MTMLEKLLLPEIRELIQDREIETLREVLNRWLPADIADLFADLADSDVIVCFQCLEPALGAQVFEYLDWTVQEELSRVLPEESLRYILNELAPDDRTAFLSEFEAADIERLLSLLTPDNQRVARSLLSYGEGTVGRLMTPDFIGVRENWTMDQVLDHVRKVGRDSESLNAVYVINDLHHLVDDIRMREILLAAPDARVESLMDRQYVALQVTDEDSTAVEQFRKYDRTVLPVVDLKGALLGVVTVDDVLDVAEEAATREIQQFGGVEALDEPYITTPVLELVRKRATWLIVLFVGELFTATAMGFFEKEIEKAVVLALFIPLIISSGGNSGSQAATLIVRAIAVGEVKLRDWMIVFKRELLSGLLLGLVLGLIGFLRIAIWSQFSTFYGPHWMLIGTTVAISLLGIVLWGTLSGSMLPFLIKRAGLDPATSSAPAVATIVDVTGLVLYFSVALLLLKGTLL